MQVQSLGREDPLEEGMTTHSSILAWRIPWTGAWWVTVHKFAKSWTWFSMQHTSGGLISFYSALSKEPRSTLLSILQSCGLNGCPWCGLQGLQGPGSGVGPLMGGDGSQDTCAGGWRVLPCIFILNLDPSLGYNRYHTTLEVEGLNHKVSED